MAARTLDGGKVPLKIKVAIRLRPFSTNEKRSKIKRIVNMKDETVFIDMDNGQVQPFTYDRAYWSHDGYKEDVNGYMTKDSSNSRYVDQEKVFQDLGLPLLENAWKGYNCSVFAYGQTGSGKSHSILGRYPNEGLVPRLCKQLFRDIKDKGDDSSQVSFSMLEIYNESVRDLLAKGQTQDNLLKVRRNGDGFYASGLKEVPVGSYKHIQELIKVGNRKKATAATSMNDQSSRSHTIATVKLTQFNTEENQTILSEIKLVDLAGSENSTQSNTSGSRLREGQNINKSLFHLGRVIETLYKNAQKGSKTTIPDFQSSSLTKLMKNAIGGNSNTVMIATISPAKDSRGLTLSTLRYAQRANTIKNEAEINKMKIEEQKKKMMQEKEEGLKVLEKRHMTDENKEEISVLKEEIARLKQSNLSRDEYWKSEIDKAKKAMEILYAANEKTHSIPHIVNVNEDPMLSRGLFYFIENGSHLKIGNGRESSKVDVPVFGISIKYNHAILRNAGNIVTLIPVDGKVWTQGSVKAKDESATLRHLDIILFGDNYNSGIFLFIDPQSKSKEEHPTFEECVSTITAGIQNELTDDDYLKGLVNQMKGVCKDANCIAEELEKQIRFKTLLLPEICLGLDTDLYQIFIKATDVEMTYYISKDDFRVLFAKMQHFYDSLSRNNAISASSTSLSPFLNDPMDVLPAMPTRMGIVVVPLKSIPLSKELPICDFETKEIGFLNIALKQCDENGKVCTKTQYKVNKSLFFKIEVQNASIIVPNEFRTSWCEFDFPGTEISYSTPEAERPYFRYSYSVVIGEKKASSSLIETMKEKALVIRFWVRYQENTEGRMSEYTEDDSRVQELNDELNEIRKEVTFLRDENEELKAEIIKKDTSIKISQREIEQLRARVLEKDE